MNNEQKHALVAFSGGLDTTYCVLYLQDLGYTVTTATVDTGGFTDTEIIEIEEKSKELGAVAHHFVDAKTELWNDMIIPLIWAEYLKGGTYPACVGAERVVTAQKIAELATQLGVDAIVHGSTGAGNDQVRFDVALRALAPGITIMTPIRDQDLSRQQSSDYLADRGFPVPQKTTSYSVNVGLLGTTIGGKETLGTTENLPEDVFPHVLPLAKCDPTGTNITLKYTQGTPTELNGGGLDGPKLLQQLNEIGAKNGFGKDYHIGTTVLGLKGRIGFEAPGMKILIMAHQQLSKLTLTRAQQFWKMSLGQTYGNLIHDGLYFEPLRNDIEAFLRSMNEVVNGEIHLKICQGQVTVTRMTSPHSLLGSQFGSYGEESRRWTGQDAAGFCTLHGFEGVIAHQTKHHTS